MSTFKLKFKRCNAPRCAAALSRGSSPSALPSLAIAFRCTTKREREINPMVGGTVFVYLLPLQLAFLRNMFVLKSLKLDFSFCRAAQPQELLQNETQFFNHWLNNVKRYGASEHGR